MNSWQEDLLTATERSADEHEIFDNVAAAAAAIGFEFCAYGLRIPAPLSNPTTRIVNNYPVAWQRRYAECNYLAIDPVVRHGRRSQAPLVWSDAVFQSTPELWAEARSHGLRVGWSKSSLDANGVGGMLTLARSRNPLNETELRAFEVKMRWLVNLAHLAMSRCHISALLGQSPSGLTGRELEVLKWTADGKTSGEISNILAVSENTVNFHVKNAVSKLQSANKTAAVVRAAMLGLLN